MKPLSLIIRWRPKNRTPAIVIGSIAILALGWLIFSPRGSASAAIVITPTRGDFIVSVTTTGELQAKNSIEIKGPATAQQAGIWQMKLSNLVPEGTVVKKGAFVGEIDKGEIANRFRESELSVQKLDAQYTQAVLDTMLTLSQARDELINLGYALEEKHIALEQSAYEAPAMRRQAQIDYDRAVRNLEQAKQNYVTKTKQSVAKLQAVEADLLKERQRRDVLRTVMGEFTILAPADGMVIYAREWNGKKRVVGSTISPWDPTVATLPDLRTMESITYVNEVDIQKITAGQKVRIKLDADPNKLLTGSITQVANIGEQRPNADSKVFEVRILINEADTTLRPAMTTSNEIIVAKTSNVLSVPLETIHAEDTTTYVYLKNGSGANRRHVRVGLMNENAAVVDSGLTETDELYLSLPPGVEEKKPKAPGTKP